MAAPDRNGDAARDAALATDAVGAVPAEVTDVAVPEEGTAEAFDEVARATAAVPDRQQDAVPASAAAEPSRTKTPTLWAAPASATRYDLEIREHPCRILLASPRRSISG